MKSFLYDSFRYFYALFKFWNNKALSYPLFLYLQPTRKCNLFCKSCDLWRISKNDPSELKKELSLDEIKKLFSSLKGKTLFLTLAGGEIFIRKDIFEIISFAKECGFGISITSNGTMITKIVAKNLERIGVNSIFFSLDGHIPDLHDFHRGKKGVFNDVMDAIDLMKKYAPSVKIEISSLITAQNYKTMVEVVKLASKKKVHGIGFTPVNRLFPSSKYGGQDEALFFKKEDVRDLRIEINNLISELKKSKLFSSSLDYFKGIPDFYGKGNKFRCFAGQLTCEVDALGNVYPCYGRCSNMGNLRENSFDKIWNSKKFDRERKIISKCSKCWDNCQVEPSLRFSPFFLFRNFFQIIKEYKVYR